MTSLTAHLETGDTFQIPVPGTGMTRFQTVTIVALPGEPGHFTGGAANGEDLVVVVIDERPPVTLHARYLAPEFIF